MRHRTDFHAITDRVFAIRGAFAALIAPPIMRETLERAIDLELSMLQLRMIIGPDAGALGNSLAAAIHRYAEENIALHVALDDERRYVAQHGPRWST